MSKFKERWLHAITLNRLLGLGIDDNMKVKDMTRACLTVLHLMKYRYITRGNYTQ